MADVEVLTEVTQADFPAEWYEIAAPGHFWFEWRFLALQHQMEATGIRTDAELKVLEIGCGHGVLRKQLERFTRWTVDGCDLNREGLLKNDSQRGRTLLYDISTRASSLENAYDVLVMYDIIEHIADTHAFLNAALFHLKKGGLVFINVPALNALFCDYDRAVGHVRRYDRASLTRDLAPHGLRVVDSRYWGFTMLPLLCLRTLQKSRGGDSAEIIRKGITPPNALLNGALRTLMRLETTVLPTPPLGTSVMAVCRYDAPMVGA